MKLNRLDTIYGVAGIPVTDLARLAAGNARRQGIGVSNV
jgi:hypothetical protein